MTALVRNSSDTCASSIGSTTAPASYPVVTGMSQTWATKIFSSGRATVRAQSSAAWAWSDPSRPTMYVVIVHGPCHNG